LAACGAEHERLRHLSLRQFQEVRSAAVHGKDVLNIERFQLGITFAK